MNLFSKLSAQNPYWRERLQKAAQVQKTSGVRLPLTKLSRRGSIQDVMNRIMGRRRGMSTGMKAGLGAAAGLGGLGAAAYGLDLQGRLQQYLGHDPATPVSPHEQVHPAAPPSSGGNDYEFTGPLMEEFSLGPFQGGGSPGLSPSQGGGSYGLGLKVTQEDVDNIMERTKQTQAELGGVLDRINMRTDPIDHYGGKAVDGLRDAARDFLEGGDSSTTPGGFLDRLRSRK